MSSCIFCRSTATPLTIEHVIPKWARRKFNIQGRVTVTARDKPDSVRREVGRGMDVLNVVLKDALCESCNNGWLGGHIEEQAARLLGPMAAQRKPTVLDAEAQRLVATWAVKTVYLLELAIRQMYPGERAVEGYVPSEVELAFMWKYKEPPPRAMVWLGCWDCEQSKPVVYEPSSAVVPTADGSELVGHLATFTLGYVAFQVFSVDFLAADQHGARQWNNHVPDSLTSYLACIWPGRQPVTHDVAWPQKQFAAEEWPRLVTWDGKLRPDGMDSYRAAS